MSDSIKFSQEGGTLEISAHEINDPDIEYLFFSIRDYGIRIPENELENIFDAFV